MQQNINLADQVSAEVNERVSPQAGLAIISPSGYAPEATVQEGGLERGLALLQQQGFRVQQYYQHDQRYLRFGASDAVRLAQLHDAARNPDIDVVMALRGSYGLSRLLHLIDYDLLAESGKIFVGYSDFTALNLALLAKTGQASYTGPMLCDDYTHVDPSPFTMAQFLACVQGPQHRVSVETPQPNGQQEIEGTLWGGNLAMIGHLLGTPFFPQVEGGILFVEDISEHPYRVERLLLQLLHAGVLARQNALILGDFSGYKLSPYDNGFDFEQMLAFIRSQLKIPVFTGLPYGHIRARACLPIGASAQLSASSDGFVLQMSSYPSLALLHS
ncbi:MAG: muramoyltetrapeptide carboxypeptidase [Burkholderiales bacterium]|nr:muramoyltetrapeptide carboxypeptidase [Burkholderiales bacterium]